MVQACGTKRGRIGAKGNHQFLQPCEEGQDDEHQQTSCRVQPEGHTIPEEVRSPEQQDRIENISKYLKGLAVNDRSKGNPHMAADRGIREPHEESIDETSGSIHQLTSHA